MNEPRRLLDDPSSSDEEKQLLGALSAPTVLADPARSAVAARVTTPLHPGSGAVAAIEHGDERHIAEWRDRRLDPALAVPELMRCLLDEAIALPTDFFGTVGMNSVRGGDYAPPTDAAPVKVNTTPVPPEAPAGGSTPASVKYWSF